MVARSHLGEQAVERPKRMAARVVGLPPAQHLLLAQVVLQRPLDPLEHLHAWGDETR